ncbi:hypothetical protein E1176_16960 [Fulvivirga sp. RKSG066]|nr:hypothetical protein [Fulvivirga aurantia]
MSCGSEVKDLENFDEETWQSDPNGCDGLRSAMVENLYDVKDELKGLNQNDITALIGKPDRHELYKRSQKFFYYQISPHSSCESGDDENIYLSIRFNATGLAKEVQIMNYQP